MKLVSFEDITSHSGIDYTIEDMDTVFKLLVIVVMEKRTELN